MNGLSPALVPPLLGWYDQGHRDLPWRTLPTPYRVWISEIMLQQTRVEAVRRYFDGWMDALPDIRALAEAGLHADPRLYGEVAYAGYRQHVCDTLDRILAMVPDTDGFFFTTHILATEALRYFHDRGIDISDGRLGLACMHEDPLFRLAAPRMSVARFPVEEISAHAVRLLLRQIRESQSPGSVRPAPESVVLPCRMEFRDE